MYSVKHNNLFIILMATSFGLGGHHQAISHKFKKSGTNSAKSSICMGSIYICIKIY